MRARVLGAAQNVTGSRFLIECDSTRLLVDCGQFQERELRARDWEGFPVEPASIDHVLLTHAHIDHCGYLPRLVRDGFSGSIFCTEPTADIARIALMDSPKLQEETARHKQRRHRKQRRSAPYGYQPLYTVEDAKRVMPLFEPISYGQDTGIAPGIRAVFRDAGHILGAAMIKLDLQEGSLERSCIFSATSAGGGVPSWLTRRCSTMRIASSWNRPTATACTKTKSCRWTSCKGSSPRPARRVGTS